MVNTLKGFITDIRYTPRLGSVLSAHPIDTFDINAAPPSGLVTVESGDQIAYSKWVSPKRTRSYPFARIYNTYHLNTKRVTIIPIIKDEGAGADLDRINFITFSWMNLLNVYIILAWYTDAHRRTDDTITDQRLDAEYIRRKLTELSSYHASALHWNTSHFLSDFEPTLRRAVMSYQAVSERLEVRVHPSRGHERFLARVSKPDGLFSIQGFKQGTLSRSLLAAFRETATIHRYESLSSGDKAIMSISNYLGGEYFLTVDEVYLENGNGVLVLQESKNSGKGGRLPKIDDVRDGLFRLILYANLERVQINAEPTEFRVRLRLTGNFRGRLRLPDDLAQIEDYCRMNQFSLDETNLVKRLYDEAISNPRISIELQGHHA